MKRIYIPIFLLSLLLLLLIPKVAPQHAALTIIVGFNTRHGLGVNDFPTFVRTIKKIGFEVIEVDGVEDAISKGVDVLIVAGFKKSLEEGKVGIVENFVLKGGAIFIIENWQYASIFGVEISDAEICVKGSGGVCQPVLAKPFTDHVTTVGVGEVRFIKPRYLSIANPDAVRIIVAEEAWIDLNGDDRIEENEEYTKDAPIAAVIKRGLGRIAIVSSTTFIDEENIEKAFNVAFARNLIEWLATPAKAAKKMKSLQRDLKSLENIIPTIESPEGKDSVRSLIKSFSEDVISINKTLRKGLAEEALKEVEALISEYKYVLQNISSLRDIEGKLKTLNSKISAAKNKGIDVSKAEKILSDAESTTTLAFLNLGRREYAEASQKIKEIYKLIEDAENALNEAIRRHEEQRRMILIGGVIAAVVIIVVVAVIFKRRKKEELEVVIEG